MTLSQTTVVSDKFGYIFISSIWVSKSNYKGPMYQGKIKFSLTRKSFTITLKCTIQI